MLLSLTLVLTATMLPTLVITDHTACFNRSSLHQQRASLVDALNARFAAGRASAKLYHAGVVLRAYDADPRVAPPDDPLWLARGGPHPGGVVSASAVAEITQLCMPVTRPLPRCSLLTTHVPAW